MGELDDEIRVAKLQLKRAMEEQLAVQGKDDENKEPLEGFELSEIKTEKGQGPKGPVNTKTVTKKRPDYRAHIDRCLARIGKLEHVRAQMGGKQSDDETAEELARKIRQAVQDIDTDENEYDVE